MVAGGFSDSGRTGAHSPGRGGREGEKGQVILCSCGPKVEEAECLLKDGIVKYIG